MAFEVGLWDRPVLADFCKRMNIDDLCAREFEHVEILRDPGIGLTAFVVIHDTRLGPAFGGIRRWTYPDADAALCDGLKLAESMTMKCAISGVPGGGGKTVILETPDLDRDAGYRAIGRAVARLDGCYYTGPDVGTTAEDLAAVAAETDRCAQPTAGHGDLAIPTALGVFAGVRAVAERLEFASLKGVHVAVQGLGDVGARLCGLLAADGARLTVTDVRADAVAEVVRAHGATAVEPAAILDVDCDVFAPCALGGVIDESTAHSIRARGVAGSANNVLASPECGLVLLDRQILYAPDFVISSGALIHGAWFYLEGAAPPAERVLAIGDRIGTILDASRAESTPSEEVAYRMARVALEGTSRSMLP